MERLFAVVLVLCAIVIVPASNVIAQNEDAQSEADLVSCFESDVSNEEPVGEGYVDRLEYASSENDYVTNGGRECVLVSDINLKIDAGYTFHAGYPAVAFGGLMDCMYKAGCYKPGLGTYVSDKCMSELCKCNQRMVVESISCGGTNSGYDCDKIKEALDNGGGAQMIVTGNPVGHAVEITDINCDLNGDGNLSGGTYRDPDKPDEKQVFVVDNKSKRILADGSINGTSATGQYTAQ